MKTGCLALSRQIPAAIGWLMFVCLSGCIDSGRDDAAHLPGASHGTTDSDPAGSATADGGGAVYFRARPPKTAGISFVHVSGISEKRHFPALNGSGLAIFDADRDGHQDVLFATACEVPVPATSLTCLTKLYRGSSNWEFRDVSAAAGMGFDGFVAGVAVADFDGDGFSDVLLSCFGPHRFHRNLGDGTFVEAHDAFPENDEFSAGATWADVDDDGFPDLYVCNYGEWSEHEDRWCGNRLTGARAFCDPAQITPVADTLYRNLGDGRFEDLTAGSSIGEKPYRAQQVLAAHLNEDRRIDFYVANDAHPNCLFVNEGDFRFRDVAEEQGVAVDAEGRAQASMGIAAGDVNQDGLTDLFVTNYTGEYNTLYRGIAPQLFLDQSISLGVARESVPLVGWGTALTDFDLDGWEDIIVVNGHTDPVIASSQGIPYQQKTLVYRNHRGHFELLADSIQDEQVTLGSSRALATADLDGDLDIDIVFGNQDSSPGLLENTAESGRTRAILVTLIGRTACRDAIGATIRLPATPAMTRGVFTGQGYLSTSAPALLLCVGPDHDGQVEVTWPSGQVTHATNLTAGRKYVILEPGPGSHHMRPHVVPQ